MFKTMTNTIKFFRPSCDKPDYYEFSNFYLSPIIINGFTYFSVEHYFQSEKFNYNSDNLEYTKEYYELIKNTDCSMKVKNLGTQTINKRGEHWYINKDKKYLGKVNEQIRKYKDLGVIIRPEWNNIRNNIMYDGLYAKFTQHKDLKDLLLSTGEFKLIESSPYESYWGVAGVGYETENNNWLGKLLMVLREELKNK